MPSKVDIDDIDLRIIELLRGDSRLSYREIGKRINASTGTVSDRVKQMVRAGVIKRFTTAIDPSLLGFEVPLFLRIRINPDRPIEDVMTELRSIDETCCIHHVTGDLDIILMVRCTDNDHAAKVLERFRSTGGVEKVESNVVLRAFPLCSCGWCDYASGTTEE
jgi:Lrp/AsnC family leucine-responsive transcriptional regulator